ncbi:hypothetical protein KC353_g226 [Hortaea werneckii]|nr:hypothetical protein KC353_g226 [Hortaea werneckii]
MIKAEDYFLHLPEYHVAVCRSCCYAVWSDRIRNHLKENHSGLSSRERGSIIEDLGGWLPLARFGDAIPLPQVVERPVEGLRLFLDGLQCRLQPGTCVFSCRSLKTLKKHWRDVHSWKVVGTRGGSRTKAAQEALAQRQANAWKPVHCQSFFATGQHAGYVVVLLPQPEESKVSQRPEPGPDAFATAILQDLTVLEQAEHERAEVVCDTSSTKEVSPWLQLTRWSSYLCGQHTPSVAALLVQPTRDSEPVLVALCESLERIVIDAHASVLNDRINAFDQVHINSFLHRPHVTDRPLTVKLQKATWKRYIRVWTGLLCFAYRTTQPGQRISLRHQLTSRQAACLIEATRHIERLSHQSGVATTGTRTSGKLDSREVTDEIDKICLDLCVSLLDHDLRGDIYESVVVGFFAVLGIDSGKGIFKEAYHYTPSLSAFIKIAQMLVIQKAVTTADHNHLMQPADLLDEMRTRFMVNGTRSPLSWASRLRVYGKKVRDSTTCLGYISWSDDNLSVSCKGITGLTLDAFRGFIRDQVHKAHAQLEDLLLLHPEERREDADIRFWMHRVVDNPAENSKNWNFLSHPTNLQGTLPTRDNWLLERVLKTEWLQDEFFCSKDTTTQLVWSQKAVRSYNSRVEAFLERLLLLVHVTSGQPARGIETLSLRHVNTMNGHHRNIFVENGMISTVTTYHKGYTTSGNTKIIHRYLPKEVGELLVYYLWMIQPLCRKLELLVLRRRDLPSPFLWAATGSLEPWDSSRLSRVMQRETKEALGVAMNIQVYRHLAVAMSRKHLPCGGFKRDYGIDDCKVDSQGSHTTWTAGTVYARGLEEAAGHVEARKSEYRKVSQEWH